MAVVREAVSIPSWKLEVGRVVVVVVVVDVLWIVATAADSATFVTVATSNRQFDVSCDIFFLVLFHSHWSAVKVERLNLTNGPSLCSESTLSIFFVAIGYQRAPFSRPLPLHLVSCRLHSFCQWHQFSSSRQQSCTSCESKTIERND